MPVLTRRRYPERPHCWHVYYGDVRVGTIAIRTGILHDEDYPDSHPGEHQSGSAASFDEARGIQARVAGVFVEPH